MWRVALRWCVTSAIALALAALPSGCTDACNKGTVFVTYALTGGAEQADRIHVIFMGQTIEVFRKDTDSSIEVQFSTYPTSPELLTLSALRGTAVLASTTKSIVLNPICSTLFFILDANSSDFGVVAAMDQAPSCQGLPANCGLDLGDTCCNSPAVAGGSFLRSFDTGGDGYDSNSTHSATVSDFRLDKYEITVGRFRSFVSATKVGMGTQSSPPAVGAGAHAGLPGSGWDIAWNSNLTADTPTLVAAVKCDVSHGTWKDDAAGGNENQPMNCITWYEAMAFCIWDGGYLPTEAEWNYAAAGGSDQRAYPWSNPSGPLSLDCSFADYSLNMAGGWHCVNGTAGGTNNVGIEPKGDGKWGQSDLAGNVTEWTLDWDHRIDLGDGVYNHIYTDPCSDCANLVPDASRVVRGGNFNVSALYLRTGTRDYYAPTTRNAYIGARCARTGN